MTTRFGAFLDTTADKLLVATALIALVAVHRASPWVALIIVGREFTILGLRAAVESGGRRFETSMLGKWKATVQFVAIALAILRPDVVILRRLPRPVGDGDRGDRHRLVWNRLHHPVLRRAALADRMTRVFVTGGTGVIGDCARGPPARAGRRGGRARALGRGGGRRCRPGAPRWSAARATTRTTLRAGWRAARSCSTSPGSTRCASRTRARWSG